MRFDPSSLLRKHGDVEDDDDAEEEEDEDEEEHEGRRAKKAAEWLQGVEAAKAVYEAAGEQLRTNLRMAHQVMG